MRVWDQVEPSDLCDKHLLGEHREIHVIWGVVVNGKRGYSDHPEVKRWVGRARALQLRHARVVEEMTIRGFNHKSPLPHIPAPGYSTYPPPWDNQLQKLQEKGCECNV